MRADAPTGEVGSGAHPSAASSAPFVSGTSANGHRQLSFLRSPVLLLCFLLLPLAYFLLRLVVYARSWPVVHDAAILRYVVFMIGAGRAPYTGMVEMNLPGALMSEWFGMHVFGPGAAGLWRWDTCMGLLAVAGGAWVAGRGARLAGLAGALFTWALHLNDGAFNTAERDWLIAALWLLAIACTAEAVERRDPRWMAGTFAVAGWCCAIKPFALVLPAALLAFAWWKERGQRRSILLWSAAGALLPVLATALYFAHWPGAFAAFVHTERTLGAWYGTLDRATWNRMLFGVLLYPELAALALVVYLLVRSRRALDLREVLLAIGAGCGLVMYAAQRKGYSYHVYPFMLCAAVLGFVLALRAWVSRQQPHGPRSWDVRVAALLFVALCAVRLPLKFWKNRDNAAYPYATQQALIQDLQSLGGPALSGEIQCLDMTLGGCIGAEYDLHLVQTTGFVNDHDLFPYPQSDAPVLREYQQRFLREMTADPPRVIVLTAHNWPDQDDRNLTKLTRWPQFAAWLAATYRVDRTHLATTAKHTASYRIYVRR